MEKGFPKMVKDLRGNLSAAPDVLELWLEYNLQRPIIRDMTEDERESLSFVDDYLVDNWF